MQKTRTYDLLKYLLLHLHDCIKSIKYHLLQSKKKNYNESLIALRIEVAAATVVVVAGEDVGGVFVVASDVSDVSVVNQSV